MNKNGFTLVEVLVVVVLIGIIFTLALPSINNLISSNGSKEYDVQIKMIKEATNLYNTKYKYRLLDVDNSCIRVNYQELKNSEDIKEDKISCTGYIILRKKDNNDFNYEYYLDCKNKNNTYFSNDDIKKQADVPTNCTDFTS